MARVEARVSSGGHDVRRKKIEKRYIGSLKLLPAAIGLANRAYLFDNSGSSHRVVAEYEEGKLASISKDLPGWFVKYVLNAKGA